MCACVRACARARVCVCVYVCFVVVVCVCVRASRVRSCVHDNTSARQKCVHAHHSSLVFHEVGVENPGDDISVAVLAEDSP